MRCEAAIMARLGNGWRTSYVRFERIFGRRRHQSSPVRPDRVNLQPSAESRDRGERDGNEPDEDREYDKERLQAPITVHVSPDHRLAPSSLVAAVSSWRTAAEQHTDSSERKARCSLSQ